MMPTPSNENKTSASQTTTDDATTSTGTRSGGGMSMNASLPNLPSVTQVDPKRLLWMGGLVAVGALGVIEWPVVAAVGIGSYVAEQFAKSEVRQEQQRSQGMSSL